MARGTDLLTPHGSKMRKSSTKQLNDQINADQWLLMVLGSRAINVQGLCPECKMVAYGRSERAWRHLHASHDTEFVYEMFYSEFDVDFFKTSWLILSCSQDGETPDLLLTGSDNISGRLRWSSRLSWVSDCPPEETSYELQSAHWSWSMPGSVSEV